MALFASQIRPGAMLAWAIGARGAAEQDLYPAKALSGPYLAPGSSNFVVDLIIQRRNQAGEVYHDARTVAIRFCEGRTEPVADFDELDGQTLLAKVSADQAQRRASLAAATSLEAVEV